jgi:hypothetical protein
MSISPVELDVKEEIDVVRLDPLFVERQRNRYASRGVAYVIWLNGLAAIGLLISLVHGTFSADTAMNLGEAMMVFGIGAAAGLASAFFAYLRRTARLEMPESLMERRVLGWLSIVAVILGAACFVGALNMARFAVIPEQSTETQGAAPAAPEAPASERLNP